MPCAVPVVSLADFASTASQEAAAQFRRQAILNGLTDFGYQVTESFEAAQVRDGKVVIKRAS